MKERYVLTDGEEIFATREMTEEEFEAEGIRAKEASNGNLSWVLKAGSEHQHLCERCGERWECQCPLTRSVSCPFCKEEAAP